MIYSGIFRQNNTCVNLHGYHSDKTINFTLTANGSGLGEFPVWRTSADFGSANQPKPESILLSILCEEDELIGQNQKSSPSSPSSLNSIRKPYGVGHIGKVSWDIPYIPVDHQTLKKLGDPRIGSSLTYVARLPRSYHLSRD